MEYEPAESKVGVRLRSREIDTQLNFTGALKRVISLLAVTNEISTAVPSTAAGAEATFLFG